MLKSQLKTFTLSRKIFNVMVDKSAVRSMEDYSNNWSRALSWLTDMNSLCSHPNPNLPGEFSTNDTSVTLSYDLWTLFFFFFVDAVDASPPDDKELVYSQPEDGKPKPIPVNEFPSYYKQKSENGAIVLRDEFKVRYVMP